MICLHHTVPVWHQYNLVADDGSAAVLPHQIQIPPPQPQGLPRVSLRLPAHALQSNLQIITSEVRTSESIGPRPMRVLLEVPAWPSLPVGVPVGPPLGLKLQGYELRLAPSQ